MKISRASWVDQVLADQSPFPKLCVTENAWHIPLKERGPGGHEAARRAAHAANYWFGSMSCVNPVVLMSRNIGVRGGSSVGFRKFTSNE
jgi:hypothetical protein